VGLVLTTTRDRKVRTAEELEAAIEEPMKVAPDPKRLDSRGPGGSGAATGRKAD